MPTRTGADLRRVDVDAPDFAPFLRILGLVYKNGARYSDEQVDQAREGMRGHRLTGAYDGDRVVGTFRSYGTGLTVPGGTLTAEAISSVGVLPTHRRRGLLTALMQDDLAAAAARGVGVAILISAEAPIYGRFGFGVAAEAVTRVLDVRAAAPRPEVADDGRVELLSEEELRGIAPAVFAAARRPGEIDLTDRQWDFRFGVEVRAGQTWTPRVAALHRDAAGRPDGYLTFRQEDVWDHRVTRAKAHVEQLEAATPQAWAALWTFLAGLDNTAEVHAEDRPVDEPIGQLFTDYRVAATVTRNDFLWSRVIDTPTVLGGRRYETPGHCVVAVQDPQHWAQGRFLLEVDPEGLASCRPTHRDAEVTLPVETLSAVWLGGTPLLGLAAAGRAREEAPGALARLDRMLRTATAPWCNTWF
jgi:predicted acetyltransferase